MIKKVIENRVKTDLLNQNGITVYPTEEILGEMKKVKDFAAFSATHKTDLKVIETSYLIDYCNEGSFTPEELKAFKFGLELISGFFKKAESDVDLYLREAELKNERSRKSVG